MNKPYIENRNLFINENLFCREFQFVLANKSSYSAYRSANQEAVRLTIDKNRENFEEIEKPFIKELIIELLKRRCNIATIENDLTYFPYVDAFYRSKNILCGPLKISVVPRDGELTDFIQDIVQEYNDTLIKSKIKIKTKGE